MATLLTVLLVMATQSACPKLGEINVPLQPNVIVQKQMEEIFQSYVRMQKKPKSKRSAGKEISSISPSEFQSKLKDFYSGQSIEEREYIRQVYIFLNEKIEAKVYQVNGEPIDLVVLLIFLEMPEIKTIEVLYSIMECYGTLPLKDKQFLLHYLRTPVEQGYHLFFMDYIKENSDVPWPCVDMMFDAEPYNAFCLLRDFYIASAEEKNKLNETLSFVSKAINSHVKAGAKPNWPQEVYEKTKLLLPTLFDSRHWWVRIYAAEAYRRVPWIRTEAAKVKMENSHDAFVKSRLREVPDYDCMNAKKEDEFDARVKEWEAFSNETANNRETGKPGTATNFGTGR